MSGAEGCWELSWRWQWSSGRLAKEVTAWSSSGLLARKKLQKGFLGRLEQWMVVVRSAVEEWWHLTSDSLVSGEVSLNLCAEGEEAVNGRVAGGMMVVESESNLKGDEVWIRCRPALASFDE